MLRASRNAAGRSYRVVALPSVPAYLNWGVSRIWSSYTNALTVNQRVLVPTYGLPERDAAALAVYRQVMPDHEIIGIDARIAANAGGTVHCLTMQIPADHGAESQGPLHLTSREHNPHLDEDSYVRRGLQGPAPSRQC